MSDPRSTLLFRREDCVPLASVVVLAVSFHAILGSLAIRSVDVTHSNFALFFDGHLYIEIAKSFPLPFGDGARDYMGQAPGYPALIALVRWLTPDALVDWGLAALIASTLPAALCASAVFVLCLELGIPPLWPSLLFVFANPRWAMVGSSAFAESLAILFALGSVIAILRCRLGASMLLLAAAGLTRFPMFLIGAPLALHWVLWSSNSPGSPLDRLRSALTLRSSLLLALPIASFALYNLYLYWRLPGFEGIADAHSVFWDTHLSWPFQSLMTGFRPGLWKGWTLYLTTYATLGLYLVSIVAGLFRLERRFWILPVAAAIIVLFHASLAGMTGTWAFGRLTIVAWPFALLSLLCAFPALARPPAAVIACAGLGIYSSIFSLERIPVALSAQARTQPFLPEKARQIQSDQPDWFDFRELRFSRSQPKSEPRSAPQHDDP